MKCMPDCKEIVHFVSPEMSSLFDHAIVNMPDGSEKYFSITPPRKWRVKGDNFRLAPLEALKPIYAYKSEVGEDGITVNTPYLTTPEIIYNSGYTGVDKRDQYYKDIRKIEKFVETLPSESSPQLAGDTDVKRAE